MAFTHVGEKIKQVRKSKKITQVELAAKAGIAQTTISAIERGSNSPTVTSLTLIASALEIDAMELIDFNKKTATQESDSKRIEVIEVYERLNDDSKRQAAAYLRFLLNEQDKKA